jgi:hypothetical protein
MARSQADKWRKWGDKREHKRLKKAGLMYEYDPALEMPADALWEEIRNIIGPRWLRRVGESAAAALRRNKGIHGPAIPMSLDLYVYIAKSAAAQIVPWVPGSSDICAAYMKHVHDAFIMFANNHGGGQMAVGMLRANKIAWHQAPPPHAVIICRTTAAEWWVLDVAFSGSPDQDRWVYQISDTDRDFWGLDM